MLDREQATADRVHAQADDLAPLRPDVGEDAAQPGRAVDVDHVLVAAAAERDVGDPAGQVTRIMARSVNRPSVRRLSRS